MHPDSSEPRSSAGEIQAGTRWLLVAFAVLTLLGVVQLLLLADVADEYWAWTIRTEATAAFLGAGYAAGFVLAVLALRQDDWSRIRVPLVTVTAFTVLTAVATVVHLHRLHLTSGGPVARAVAWVWLAVYLVIPLACLVVVARQERHRGRSGKILRPMPDWLTALLAAEGAVLFAAGAVLFAGGLTVHHHVPESAMGFWPWALMPLGAQVIGAWLIAFGVAAAMAIHQGDLSRLLVSAVAYTAFGGFELVAVIWHWPQVSRHGPWRWTYLLVIAAIVLTGAYGWWAARQGPIGRSGPDRVTEARRPATSATRGRSEVGE
jgi:hypothetical protein